MAWTSPTGHTETGDWNNEGNVYDEDTGTFATCPMTTDGERWSPYIELTHAALDCDRFRFWCLWDGMNRKDVNVDLYYDGDWQVLYDGACASGEFVEVINPAGTKSVTAARFRQTVGASVGLNIMFYEFDFGLPTAYTESASVIIGTVASATRRADYDRDSSVIIGNLVSATRVVAVIRAGSVIVGNLVTAARAAAFGRSSTISIGTVVSAFKSWNRTIMASVAVGCVVSASRTVTYIRTSSVIVGTLAIGAMTVKMLRPMVSFTNRKVMNIFTNIRSWISHTNRRTI